MTPILHQLHWLPIRQRILFKTAVLVYKCRHGMAPSYLSTYCMPTSSHDGRCHLCSAASAQLSVLLTTVAAVSLLVVRPCGTVYQLSCTSTGHVTVCISYTAQNIFDDNVISYNSCNSRHVTFAAFFEFASYK